MMILDSLVFQLFVYCQLFVYFSQINHLEASDTETAQGKDVNNKKKFRICEMVSCLFTSLKKAINKLSMLKLLKISHCPQFYSVRQVTERISPLVNLVPVWAGVGGSMFLSWSAESSRML